MFKFFVESIYLIECICLVLLVIIVLCLIILLYKNNQEKDKKIIFYLKIIDELYEPKKK